MNTGYSHVARRAMAAIVYVVVPVGSAKAAARQMFVSKVLIGVSEYCVFAAQRKGSSKTNVCLESIDMCFGVLCVCCEVLNCCFEILSVRFEVLTVCFGVLSVCFDVLNVPFEVLSVCVEVHCFEVIYVRFEVRFEVLSVCSE